MRGGERRGSDAILQAHDFGLPARVIEGHGDGQKNGRKSEGENHRHHTALIARELSRPRRHADRVERRVLTRRARGSRKLMTPQVSAKFAAESPGAQNALPGAANALRCRCWFNLKTIGPAPRWRAIFWPAARCRRARPALAAPSRQQAQKKSARNGARQERAPRACASSEAKRQFQPGAAASLRPIERTAQAMACACHSRNITSRQRYSRKPLGQRY